MSPESLLTPTSLEDSTGPGGPVPSPYGEAYYTSGNYENYLQRGPEYTALAGEMLLWLESQGMRVWGPGGDSAVVLDFGCGVGHLVAGLWKYGVRAFGYDPSRWAVSIAMFTITPPVVMCDFAQVEGRFFDLLVSFDVFEHMALGEVFDALSRLEARHLAIRIPVSKIDGRPYVLPCSERDPTHRLRLTKASWAAVFRAAGYEEVARPALKHWWDSEGVYCALFRRKS